MITQIAIFLFGFAALAISISIWGREPGAWIGIIAFLLITVVGYLTKQFRSARRVLALLPVFLIPSYFLFFLVSGFVGKHNPRGLSWFLSGVAAVSIYITVTANLIKRFWPASHSSVANDPKNKFITPNHGSDNEA